jgi:glycine/D-amino acid oxidase-like deaminating enzyme/nitrite reductase/ring-hydroxylating ferredoxin subunit
MRQEAGKNATVWESGDHPPSYSPLQRDTRADVCVIGGGMAGLCTAYQLARDGQSVVLLEDGAIGSGQTSRTSAHLSNAIDDRYHEVERIHGTDAARLAAQSHTAAIDLIERIVSEERIDCTFERLDGYLVLAPGQTVEALERERDAAIRAGLNVELLKRAPVLSFDSGPALRFPNQAQFHPMAFLSDLARAAERRGVRIHTHTHATEIHGGDPARVETKDGAQVHANHVVVATNVPINDRVVVLTKQAAYTTYVIALRMGDASFAPMLLWDDDDPYHYVRMQRGTGVARGPDLLLVGGEDHRSGQADDADERFARLERWALDRFPSAGPVVARWSGQVMETVDGLAFIGRNPVGARNVYVITGDSGMGLTHSGVAAQLIPDLVRDRPNPWAELYDPARKPLKTIKRYAQENVRTAAQYAEWFTAGEDLETSAIRRGEGAVVRRGLHKVAAYRDEYGELHELNAACPHLGCIVHWNRSEKTWDCPCHGSRFEANGRVIVGPANSDLKAESRPSAEAAGF